MANLHRNIPEQTGPLMIAVGASGADGLQDIRDLVSAFPRDVEAAVLVSLHRPPDIRSALSAILQRCTALRVAIPSPGERLGAGVCYIGEPARHLILGFGGRAAFVGGDHRHFRNRTIDLLFRSVASQAGAAGVGIILSGSLADGSRGLAAIRDAGGATLVRSPRPLATGDMPRNAIRAACPVDLVGSIPELAQHVVRARAPGQVRASCLR